MASELNGGLSRGTNFLVRLGLGLLPSFLWFGELGRLFWTGPVVVTSLRPRRN